MKPSPLKRENGSMNFVFDLFVYEELSLRKCVSLCFTVFSCNVAKMILTAMVNPS